MTRSLAASYEDDGRTKGRIVIYEDGDSKEWRRALIRPPRPAQSPMPIQSVQHGRLAAPHVLTRLESGRHSGLAQEYPPSKAGLPTPLNDEKPATDEPQTWPVSLGYVFR